MNDLSDADLIARCLSTDATRAFDELYERHGPCVRAFLHGFTGGDEHRVADCAQATWMRAFRALPRFDRERALRPWLLTIAARVAIDAEASRRRVDVVDDETLVGLSVVWPDSRADVRADVDRLLREAATRVSARKLEAFLLSRAHGLAHREVAARTGSSIATVKRDVAETASILAGLAEELGLLPERLAAAVVVREPATVGWTPPADGLLTARQVDHVVAFFRGLREMGDAMRDHPVEDVAQAQAFVARFAESTTESEEDGAEEALFWANGVVKRTARALLATDRAVMQKLRQQAVDDVREDEERHAKTRALRDQAERALGPEATEADRAAGAREREEAARALEVTVRSADMFMRAADEAVAKELASGGTTEAEVEELGAMMETRKIRAELDAARARLEALRRGDAAAWLEHIDKTEAEQRASVERARALAAAIEQAAGDDGQGLLLGIPARNADLVRVRLDDVVSALGHRVIMDGGEW